MASGLNFRVLDKNGVVVGGLFLPDFNYQLTLKYESESDVDTPSGHVRNSIESRKKGSSTKKGDPKWGNVRKLLLKCFTKEQLLEFCLVTSDFEDLYESLAEGDAQKGEIIREIIAHAKRIGKIKIILNWAENETDRYKEFSPYFEIISSRYQEGRLQEGSHRVDEL